MPTMNTIWPRCTVLGCTHKRTHPDEAALRETIRTRSGRWTNKNGRAVCACHPNEAARLSLTPFLCDEVDTADAPLPQAVTS